MAGESSVEEETREGLTAPRFPRPCRFFQTTSVSSLPISFWYVTRLLVTLFIMPMNRAASFVLRVL